MSTLAYNGVGFAWLQTLEYGHGPEYDPSRTDQLLTRTDIKVRGVIRYGTFPAVPGELPGQTADRITHLLTQPRAPLVFAPSGGGGINLPNGDDAHGPLPDERAFSIELVSDAAWVVTWACSVRRVLCTGASSQGRPYLSLRWSDVVRINENWLEERTRSGLMVVARGTNPDDFRFVVTPDVPQGFDRRSAEYTRDESGLRLRFRFVDRQRGQPLPWPLTDIDGRQTEFLSFPGAQRKGDLRLRCTAPPAINKRDVLDCAIRIGLSRVYASDPLRGKTSPRILLGGAISEPINLRENTVELHLQWNMKPYKGRNSGTNPPSGKPAPGFSWIGAAFPGLWLAMNPGAAFPALNTAGQLLNAVTPEGKSQASVNCLAPWLGLPLPGGDAAGSTAPPADGLAPWVRLAAAALNDPCGSSSDLRLTATDASLSTGWSTLTTGAGGQPVASAAGTGGGASVSAMVTSDQSFPMATDEDGLDADTDGPGVWDHFQVTSHYVDDTGQEVMPAAEPGGDCKLVRVHGGELRLRVEWALTRVGGAIDPAQFQPAEATDPYWVYLRGTTSPANLDHAADGVSVRYDMAGTWEFACLKPSKAQFRYPVPTWLERNFLLAASKSYKGLPAQTPNVKPPSATTTPTGGGTDQQLNTT